MVFIDVYNLDIQIESVANDEQNITVAPKECCLHIEEQDSECGEVYILLS